MKSFTGVVMVGVAVLLVPVVSAQAELLTYIGVGPNEVVTTHAAGLLADNLSVYAGSENMSLGSVSLAGYCVDLNQYSGSGQVTLSPLTTLPNAGMVNYLLDKYAPLATTNASAAALAVALWEVTTETGPMFDATSGFFSITGNDAVATDANVLLASLPETYAPGSDWLVLQSDTVQDFVVPGSVGVPEPAAAGMLLLGGLVLLRRHGRSQPR
jgi:hypothetical protein